MDTKTDEVLGTYRDWLRKLPDPDKVKVSGYWAFHLQHTEQSRMTFRYVSEEPFASRSCITADSVKVL